jgi:uncharacterized protein YbjT (DUF2867 family)
VRAVGRQGERLAPLVAKGAEARTGDLKDAAFVTEAFRGADAVFAMVPPHYNVPDIRADQRRIGASLVEALEDAAVPRAVALSSVGARLPSGTGPIAGLHEFEEMLRTVSGLSVVVLRAAFFMENHLASLPLIKSAGTNGSSLRGDLPLPMVATGDIAAAAAEIFSGLAFKGHSVRDVLGPRDYTMREATALLGAAIGKPDLGYGEFGYDDLRKALVGARFSPDAADAIVEMNDAFNTGRIQATFKRTRANTTPTTLEQFARDVFAPAYLAG